MSTTIILCEGDQTRLWNCAEIKQLINFGGRPLLARTIEQIRKESPAEAIIINAKRTETWQKFADEQGVMLLPEPSRQPDQDFLDVLKHFRRCWDNGAPTTFIYGDVVWSHRMMKELYKSRENNIWFPTRFSPVPGLGTWRAELFGFRFHVKFHGVLDGMLASRKPSPYHEISDVWGLFHWLMDTRDSLPDEPSFLDAGEDDYTFDIDYPGDVEGLPILEILAAEENNG